MLLNLVTLVRYFLSAFLSFNAFRVTSGTKFNGASIVPSKEDRPLGRNWIKDEKNAYNWAIRTR